MERTIARVINGDRQVVGVLSIQHPGVQHGLFWFAATASPGGAGLEGRGTGQACRARSLRRAPSQGFAAHHVR
jgi:hypothetical protein